MWTIKRSVVQLAGTDVDNKAMCTMNSWNRCGQYDVPYEQC